MSFLICSEANETKSIVSTIIRLAGKDLKLRYIATFEPHFPQIIAIKQNKLEQARKPKL